MNADATNLGAALEAMARKAIALETEEAADLRVHVRFGRLGKTTNVESTEPAPPGVSVQEAVETIVERLQPRTPASDLHVRVTCEVGPNAPQCHAFVDAKGLVRGKPTWVRIGHGPVRVYDADTGKEVGTYAATTNGPHPGG